MKFDEKTGNKIPENRRDEVKLTIEEINKMRKETNGMHDAWRCKRKPCNYN